MVDQRDAILWTTPERTGLLKAACDAAGLRVTAAGCGERGRASEVAQVFGAEAFDDVRAGVASSDAAVLLLAAPADDLEASAVAAFRARGGRVVMLDPVPMTTESAASGGWLREQSGVRGIDGLRVAPQLRLQRSFREAIEVLEAFGPIEAVSVRVCRSPDAGGIRAAGVDAVGVLAQLIGEPELVDAAAIGRAGGPTAAAVRFADGRIGQWLLTTDGLSWDWSVRILGPGGAIAVEPSGFVWIDGVGEERDRYTADAATTSAADALAHAIRSELDGGGVPASPLNLESVLCVLDAARLSTRTGQPESPATIRRAVSAV